MGHKESDNDSAATVDKEDTLEKKSLVRIVVLVNSFLFSSCFFMGKSVFPVSICVNVCKCYFSWDLWSSEKADSLLHLFPIKRREMLRVTKTGERPRALHRLWLVNLRRHNFGHNDIVEASKIMPALWRNFFENSLYVTVQQEINSEA